MVTWFLLISMVNGAPQSSVYAKEQDACNAYLVAKASNPSIIYELSGKKDNPSVTVGDCKPVQQFVTK